MARAWAKYGDKALEKCAKKQPAAYMKICALLVPREMKVQHSQNLKNMSDEELDAAIGAVRAMLHERAKQGEMIDVTPEPEQGKK
jgi:ribosomal protein S11